MDLKLLTATSPHLSIDKKEKNCPSLFSCDTPYRHCLASYTLWKNRLQPPPNGFMKHDSKCSTCSGLYGMDRGDLGSFYDTPPRNIIHTTDRSFFQLTSKSPSLEGRSEKVKYRALLHFLTSVIQATSLIHTSSKHHDHVTSQIDLVKGILGVLGSVDEHDRIFECVMSKIKDRTDFRKINDVIAVPMYICLDLINGEERALIKGGTKVTHPHAWLKIKPLSEECYGGSVSRVLDKMDLEFFINTCSKLSYLSESFLSTSAIYGKIFLTVFLDVKNRSITHEIGQFEVDVPVIKGTEEKVVNLIDSLFLAETPKYLR
jgi:hypothetical protein